MSRVAKNPIILPSGVEVTLGREKISVKGPLGFIEMDANPAVKIEKEGTSLLCSPSDESVSANTLSGTIRAILANMVTGVSQGFERKLVLHGTGYRAQVQGDTLNLMLGFSHPVVYKMPVGIKCETSSQTEILIKGVDKQLVGQVAADVRAYRKPEPYKGKGVRYFDEVIILKETKKK